MTVENPYRAAGAFAGKAYIRRGADAELVEQIRDNQYYPYFAAPRQSGKSSLIARTMASLPEPEFRCALVDLSPFVVRSYDDFWRQFMHEVARSANFDPTPISKGDPRDAFTAWLAAYPGRLVVFIDEIDVLLHVECREQIFSKIRTFFNLRAHEAALQRLTFVLAGAAHSSRFISDPRWSPFNVAIEIALEDLSMAQVSQLASYLATAGAFAGPDLVGRVYGLTGGSVFLCQLVFETLWSRAARGKKKLDASDVDAVIASIVAESPRNIHFYNIFRLITQDSRLAMLFRRLIDGEELGEEDHKELQLTGLCRGMNPFRNDVYARVFGTGGPLDLKVAGTKVTLGRKLEAAITMRQRLEDDGHKTTQVEAEIAALKREFREGAQLREGDLMGRGRYRLLTQIGQGGFATVWRAHDETTGREVALKVLHGQFAEDKTRRDRFFRGAWKMSELKHPAVVEVVEPYGEEAGRHFFVMEYMSGGTFHETVLDKKMSADAIVAAIVAVGRALAHAHARGLVHRDVKPSNVLLAPDQTAKLTDFDLVREQDASGSTRTGPMGSFIYAAPEVLSRPQDADHRADIYGLAMTAVFGLHGAELPLEVVRDSDRFIDRLHCGGVLKDVLKKGVAWEIERRFSSAAEFTQALMTGWADKEAPPAPVPAPVPVPVQAEAPKKAVATWTAMFATLPAPETGPLAAPAVARAAAIPVAPMAVREEMGAQPVASATVASDAGATVSELAFEEQQATVAGGVAEVDAPTQMMGRATEVRAAAPAPVMSRSNGSLLAALGLVTTAALVLLALQIAGPGPNDRLGGEARYAMSNNDLGLADRAESVPRISPPAPDFKKASEDVQTEARQGSGETVEEATGGVAELVTTTTDEPAVEQPEQTSTSGAALPAKAEPAVRKKPTVSQRIDEGCLKVRAGNAETGVALLKKVREDRPHDVQLINCLADGLMKIGDYSAAEHFFGQLIAEYPRNKRGYVGAAQANENMGRRDLAAKYYRQVLVLDPHNKSALAFMANHAGAGNRLPPGGGLDYN